MGYETFSQSFLLERGKGKRISTDVLPLDIIFDNSSLSYHFEVEPVYGMYYRSDRYLSSESPRFFGITYEYAGARIAKSSTEEFDDWNIRVDVEEGLNGTLVDVGYRIPLQPAYTVRGKVYNLLKKNLTSVQLASRVETNCHASDFRSFEVELEVAGKGVSLKETTRPCVGEVKRSEERFDLLKDERPLENLSFPLLAFDYSTTNYILNRQVFENTRTQDDFGIGNRVSGKMIGTGQESSIEVSYASYFDIMLGEITINGEQYLFSFNANLKAPPEGQVFLSSMFPSRGKSMPKEVPRDESTLGRPPKVLEMTIDKTKD